MDQVEKVLTPPKRPEDYPFAYLTTKGLPPPKKTTINPRCGVGSFVLQDTYALFVRCVIGT